MASNTATKQPKQGDKYRVKCTPILRRYGMRCSLGEHASDYKVWPKEIGVVVVFQGNGWQGMQLEFSRGRTVQLGTLYSDSEEWELQDEELAQLIRCK